MKINYIDQIPLPACVVDTQGTVLRANALIKNVFVYEDIVGTKFFTLTGLRREDLMRANQEEVIIERNERLFRIRTNENISSDGEIAVFFEEATA
jgi:PAS domain-containing protein